MAAVQESSLLEYEYYAVSTGKEITAWIYVGTAIFRNVGNNLPLKTA
jgi:hypothetical protein